jgi:Flp pilus assembly protein TadG
MTVRPTWMKRLLAPAIRRGKAFGREDDGAVAVEFALLALPFFTIIFAILETAMVFFAQQVLDSAVQDTSRFIQTGQAQAISANWDLQDFRDAMCPKLYGMFACNDDDKLRIIVTPVTDFNNASTLLDPSPIEDTCEPGAPVEDCDWDVTSSYNDGTRNEVMLVEAYYKWPVLVNLPWFNLATQAGNTRLLSAARVFVNEPF